SVRRFKMKKVAALIALAGLATSALAQPGSKNQIDIKVRVNPGDPWVDTLTLQSANLVDPIVVEVGVFYYRNNGFSFATCVHNVVGSPWSGANGDAVDLASFDNPDSALHPDDRVGFGGASAKGGFNNGGQFQAVYHTGTSGVDANRFRIAASSNAGDALAGG